MKKLFIPMVCACGAIALTTHLTLADECHPKQTKQTASQDEAKPLTGMQPQEESALQPQGGTLSSLRFSQLQGTSAKSKDGQDIGEIEDVLIDPKTGQVKFAILQRGGFMGIGERRVPVPWQALNVNTEQQCVVNIDQEKLNTAPTLTQDQYQDLANPDYVIRVYRFYTIEPAPAMGAPGTESGMESGRGQPDLEPKDQQEHQEEKQKEQEQQPQEEATPQP